MKRVSFVRCKQCLLISLYMVSKLDVFSVHKEHEMHLLCEVRGLLYTNIKELALNYILLFPPQRLAS
jgi:hypothetical protein